MEQTLVPPNVFPGIFAFHKVIRTSEHKHINLKSNYNFQTVQMTCALSRYTETQCHFSGVLNGMT